MQPTLRTSSRRPKALFGFLAILDGRYRAIRRRWKAYRAPGNAAPCWIRLTDLRRVDRYLSDRQSSTGSDSWGRALFGSLWKGEQSDVAALDRYVAWVVKFRALSFGIVYPRALAHLRRLPVSTPRPFERCRSSQRRRTSPRKH